MLTLLDLQPTLQPTNIDANADANDHNESHDWLVLCCPHSCSPSRQPMDGGGRDRRLQEEPGVDGRVRGRDVREVVRQDRGGGLRGGPEEGRTEFMNVTISMREGGGTVFKDLKYTCSRALPDRPIL